MKLFKYLDQTRIDTLYALIKRALIDEKTIKLVFHNVIEYLAKVEEKFELKLPDIYIDWDSLKVTNISYTLKDETIWFIFNVNFYTNKPSIDDVSYNNLKNLLYNVTVTYPSISCLPPFISINCWKNLTKTSSSSGTKFNLEVTATKTKE